MALTLTERARRVRLVLLDVDGVLTDGKILVHADGTESKTFDIRDGTGIVLAQKAGVRVGLLSARQSAVDDRAGQSASHHDRPSGRARQADDLRGAAGRARTRQTTTSRSWATICSTCPCSAGSVWPPRPPTRCPRCKAVAHWVSRARGGDGAVRELAEVVLKAQDRWNAAGRRVDPGSHTTMTVYLPMLVALVALLAGLAIGKAWERYKLRDGQWIDRRKARESPHFIVGLDLVVANQIDQAIDELSRAAWLDEDALEIHLVLGNLYREKGQVGRAINIHQGLLQRQHLKTLEHAYILLCLGLDFRRGGFVDRAHEAFKEVLRLDPKNRHALIQLEKLHEEQHQWAEAYDIRQQLAEIDAAGPLRARDNAILAFLENELGDEASKAGDRSEAARRFVAAIDRDRSAAPAYLSLGDVKLQDGDVAGAIAAWEDLIEASPDRAYLAFDRLQAAYATHGSAAAVSRPVPAIDRGQLTGLARAARAGSSPRGGRRCQHRPRTAVRGAGAQPARADDSPGDLAGAVGSGPQPAVDRAVSGPDAGCRLLSRPARLRALPLPEHRTALAVPAMPRVEYLHRRAHGARQRRPAAKRLKVTIAIDDCRLRQALSQRSGSIG